MKTPNKKNSINPKKFALSLLSTIFIIGGSFLIYYFSKGYRIDISKKDIKKTGVIIVETEPSFANLYINSNSIGRTPRSRTLDIGTHKISIWKDGYREWNKDVEILEEKSTPIFPFLILEELPKSTLWESKGTIEKYWISKYKDYFVFLQKDSDTTYSLWHYRINTTLWSLNQNPIQILPLETNNIEIQISPNGLLALLTVNEEPEKKTYLLELQKPTTLENLTPLEISDLNNYTITWAKDNRYLVLESSEDIISLDTVRNIRYLLTKKSANQEYIWTTDEESFFYTIEALHKEEDSTYTYALKQIKLDGSNPAYTIEKIYFQKDSKYIEYYRNNGTEYPEFSNSPQSTQTTGQITYFEVNQTAKGVYIKTDTSTYWYDMLKNKYRMISPYPAELIQFSPDSRKLLLANGESLYVFTFDKEEADHTETIGSKKIDNLMKDQVSNINWLSNSSYVYFFKDNTLHISEKDGENDQQVLNMENILLYSIKTSREHIITLEQNEKFSINQYKIQ